jgi:hypothetical protein
MLACIIWGYWWLTAALAIIFLFMFPNYYEIIFWGVMYDALYGLSLPQFFGVAYVFSIASILLFLISILLRKLLSAYEPTI